VTESGPLRSQKLGVTADTTADSLAEQFALTRADVERVALARLAREPALVARGLLDPSATFAEELRAHRAAQSWVAGIKEAFGARAHLHLTVGQPVKVRARRVERDIFGTMVFRRRTRDGRIALGVQIGDGREELVLEALRVIDGGTEAVVPVAAIALASPIVPVARGEIVRGSESVVFGVDGTRQVYVGDGLLADDRRASFVVPAT